MARRLTRGHQLSPFSPDEERDGLQKCQCSTFIPGSQQTVPQYVASAYFSGDIRIHDTNALVLSASDGITASHLRSFVPSPSSIVQMDTMTAGTETMLITLEEFGNVNALSLKGIFDESREEERHVQPRVLFHLAHSVCPSLISCFTVDDLNKRIFTGGADGSWLCWDIERSTHFQEMLPHQSYQTHQSCVLDGDYCQGLLASASEDGSVCVWDVRSQSCICAFDPATGKHLPLSQTRRRQHCSNEASLSVCFDHTGRHIVASSRQKHITVWNIRSDTAQCSFYTDSIPYTLDTAGDHIFFSGADDRVWRYSMFHALMQCYQTTTSAINHIRIDKELQKTMVISGGADTVELLSLDGQSLGKATGRKRQSAPESHPIFSPVQLAWSPSIISDSDGQDIASLGTPQYSPEMDELCESGSELAIEDDEEMYGEDDGSSNFEYSQANGEIAFSSEDDEDMHSVEGEDEAMHEIFLDSLGPVDLEGENLENYGFTSDSDISPREDFVMSTAQEYSNCEFSSSQEDSGSSEEEEEEQEEE